MTCRRCGHPPRDHVGYNNGCIHPHGAGSTATFCGCVGWDGVWNAEPPAPASTPPHEQQNEPSSSPSRAPGDEPADEMTDADIGWFVVRTMVNLCEMGDSRAAVIAGRAALNARRAAPPSTENPNGD